MRSCNTSIDTQVYQSWNWSLALSTLKIGWLDLGCQATFDRFFRGYERFYTCAARHPTGILWAPEGHLGLRKSPDRPCGLGLAVVLLEHSKNNSWSKFMGGRKVAVSLHPMKPRHFRGGRTLDDLSQRDIPFNSCGELTPQMQESSERDAHIWGCQRKHIIK